MDGRQRYLGSFEDEKFAARIYDIAALTLKGDRVKTNFPKGDYESAMHEIQALATRESEESNKVRSAVIMLDGHNLSSDGQKMHCCVSSVHGPFWKGV